MDFYFILCCSIHDIHPHPPVDIVVRHSHILPPFIRIVQGKFDACIVDNEIVLIIANLQDSRILLIPWIVTIILFTIQDLVYIFYHFFEYAVKWNPSIAILITIDVFLNSLNVILLFNLSWDHYNNIVTPLICRFMPYYASSRSTKN